MADNRFDGAFGALDAPVADVPVLSPGDDAPGDDRSDVALRARTEAVERDQMLDWLMQEQAEQTASAGAGAPADPDTIGSTWRWVKDSAIAVGADIGKGVVEAPRQIAGGARDATQSMVDLAYGAIDPLADWLNEKVPLGAVQVFDREGNFAPDYIPPSEVNPDEPAPALPEIKDASTNTGALVRKASQFLTGFVAGGKALNAVAGPLVAGAGAGAQAGRAAAQGAIADFAAFDGHEARLSNLVQEFPALQNPVTEYLAADPNDSEIEGRLKNSLEGLGLGVLTDGMVLGLRAIRASRAARALDPDQIAKRGALAAGAIDADVPTVAARDLNLLGPEDAPLIQKGGRNVEKEALAAVETELGVPIDVAARSLTEKGLTPLGSGDYYVNFRRIESPEDIQRVIQDASSAFADDVSAAARGVRSNEQTVTDAATIDAWEMLQARRKGQPLNAEQSVAARELWVASATKLKEVAELASATPTPENLFEFRRMLAIFHGVQKEVLAARAETARALQSWAIPVGGGRTRMAAIENALNNYGGVEVSQKLAQSIVAADRAGGIGAVSEMAEKSLYAKSRDAVQEYWINSILSGPKTHLVNLMSNTSVIGMTMGENAVAARLGRVLGGDDVVMVGEAMANWHGIRNGFFDALRNAGKALRTGQTGFGINKIEAPMQRAISSTAWNLRSDSMIGRAVDGLGAVVNLPGRLLQTEDEFFKTIGYRMSLHQQAYRQAAREVQEGTLKAADLKARYADLIANPTEEMTLEGAARAAYQTFTSEPGPLIKKLNAIRSQYPALRFIMPFVQTPANIFKYVAERTPIAPLTARYRAAIAKGGADADLARTKMALGTMSMLFAMDLALDGHLTGSGPSNKAERDALLRTGWRPYSVKIGDKYVAYNRLDPLGTLLQFGADLGEYAVNATTGDDLDDAEFEEAVYAAIFSVVEAVTSKSYLSGLTDTAEAISDPKRFGESFAQRFVGGFVPAAVNEVRNFNDPVRRHTATMIDALKNRLPGYSDDLPAKRDMYGREMRYESGMGRFYDAFSPFYGSTANPEPIDELMLKDGWYLGMPSNAFTIDGERVSLRNMPEAYSRFLELRGSTKPSALGERGEGIIDRYGDLTMLETLNAIVSGQHELSEEFAEQETPEEREDFVRKVVRNYQKAAQATVLLEFPEITERAMQKKLSRETQ